MERDCPSHLSTHSSTLKSPSSQVWVLAAAPVVGPKVALYLKVGGIEDNHKWHCRAELAGACCHVAVA